MRLLWIFKKSVLELIREYKGLSFIILTPVFFIAIFGYFYGQGMYTCSLAVTNEDRGASGREFVDILKNSSYMEGTKAFTITEMDNNPEQVKTALEKREYGAHLYIPPNFSEEIADKNGSGHSDMVLTADPSESFFTVTELMVEFYLNDFLKEKLSERNPVTLKTSFIAETKTNSEFGLMVPGLIIISIFFLIIESAMFLAEESEHRTLQRMLLTRMKVWELYGGITLSQIALAAVIVPLLFITAGYFGFQSSGSYSLAFFIVLLSALSSVAIGMVVAAFSKTSMEAFIIGNVVLTPMFFLSGIFFPPPSIKLFTVFGNTVELFSLQPSLHAVNAMNKVLLRGAGLGDILFDLTMLILLSAIILCAGIYFFNKRHIINS